MKKIYVVKICLFLIAVEFVLIGCQDGGSSTIKDYEYVDLGLA